MATNNDFNPYVGPRPFRRDDQNIFFGRDEEILQLSALIGAYSTVLLYAQSGAGKSSLINAGLIPELERDEFQVLPPVRVGVKSRNVDNAEIPNIYIYNAITSIESEEDEETLKQQTLSTFLRHYPRKFDEFEIPFTRVLIFDQFEELFTTFPERWEDRKDFFEQVKYAIQEDPNLTVLFVMREDYIAEIEGYRTILPNRLETEFRLERLKQDTALSAVTLPLERLTVKKRTYGTGVAEALVSELQKIRVISEDGKVRPVKGEFIEPVVLQVVCESLWNSLPSDVDVVTLEHIEEHAQVDDALKRYYEDCLNKVISAIDTVTKEQLVNWFSNELITPAGTRAPVYQDADNTGSLPNKAVTMLENLHIIRGEQRSNARWYELSHDSFLQPIRDVNEEFLLKEERRKADEQRLRAEKVERKFTGDVSGISAFFSYSRRNKDTVTMVAQALQSNGIETWIDWEDIAPSVNWRQEIRQGIASSDIFLTFVSKDSLDSEICYDEFQYARELGKRIIPVLIGDVTIGSIGDTSALPERWSYLSELQPVDMRPNVEIQLGLGRLLNALAVDSAYIRTHTRYLMRAKEWETRDKADAYLLTRGEVEEAEQWLLDASGRTPAPIDLHREFISTSKKFVRNQENRSRRRLQWLAFFMSISALLAVFLSVIALNAQQAAETQAGIASTSRADAETQAVIAQNNALTATVAQGDAVEQANIAQTQEALAQNLLITSEFQGEQIALEITNVAAAQGTAESNAIDALNNALTATIAQGEAIDQAATAAVLQDIAESLSLSSGALQSIDDGRPDTALAYALEANAIDDPPLASQQSLITSIRASALIDRWHNIGSPIVHLAMSDDYLVTIQQDNSILLRDPETTAVLDGVQESVLDIRAVKFSPDGSLLAVGGCAGNATTGNCTSGFISLYRVGDDTLDKQPTKVTFTNGVNEILFGYFERYFGDSTALYVYEDGGRLSATGIEITDDTIMLNREFAISIPNVSALDSASNSQTFWGISSVNLVAHKVLDKDTSNSSRFTDTENAQQILTNVAVSPGGEYIITGGQSGSLVVWNSDGTILARDNVGARIEAISFDRLSNRFAVGTVSGLLHQYRLTITGSSTELIKQRILIGHSGAVVDLTFGTTPEKLYSYARDGFLHLWDTATDLTQIIEGHTSPILDLETIPNSTLFASLTNKEVFVWDASTGGKIQTYTPEFTTAMAVSPDGQMLAIGATVYDIETGRQRLSFSGYSGEISQVAFSTDGELVSTYTTDDTLIFWNMIGRQRGRLDINDSEIQSPLIAHTWLDDAVVAITSQNDVIRIDSQNFRITSYPINLAEGVSLRDLAISPVRQNRILLSTSNGSLIVLDNFEVTDIVEIVPVSIDDIEFSPNGRYLAAGTSNRQVALLDGEIFTPYTYYQGVDLINALAFSYDTQMLFSAEDDIISNWRVEQYGDEVEWILENRFVEPLTCQQLKLHTARDCVESTEVAVVPTETFTPLPTLQPTNTHTPTVTPSPTATLTPSPTVNIEDIVATLNAQATQTQQVQDAESTQIVLTQIAQATSEDIGTAATATNTPPLTATPTPNFTASLEAIIGQTLTAAQSTPTATPTATASPSLTPTPTPANVCSNVEPRLNVGDIAVVTQLLNFRNEPTVNANLITSLRPGYVLSVLEGPVCADGFTWYQVNYQGQIGWSAESFDTEYYLAPVALSIDITPLDLSNITDSATLSNVALDLSGLDNTSETQLITTSAQDDTIVTTSFLWGAGALDDSCGIQIGSTRDESVAIQVNRLGNVIETINGRTNIVSTSATVNTGRNERNTLVFLISRTDDTVISYYLNGRYANQISRSSANLNDVSIIASTGGNSETSGCTFEESLVIDYAPETAYIPPSPTPIPTATPTATVTPTSTFTPSITPSPTLTPAPENLDEAIVPFEPDGLLYTVAELNPEQALIRELVFSPDSLVLVSAATNGLSLWETDKFYETNRLLNNRQIIDVDINSDGTLIAIAKGRSVALWDMENREEILEITEHTSNVSDVSFSYDDRYVASSSIDGTVRVLDVESGETVHVFNGASDRVTNAFSPIEGLLAFTVGAGESVELREMPNGDLIHRLDGHTRAIEDLQFSPDGTMLATASWDRTVKLWDVASGELLSNIPHDFGVNRVAFSPTEPIIATGALNGKVRLWDYQTGADKVILTSHDADLSALTFDTTGQLLFSGSRDSRIFMHDTRSGQLLNRIEEHNGTIWDMKISPDNRYLASGDSEGMIYISSIVPEESCVGQTTRETNLRPVPDVTSEVLDLLPIGYTFLVTGETYSDTDEYWIQVNGQYWIWASSITLRGNCDLPTLDAGGVVIATPEVRLTPTPMLMQMPYSTIIEANVDDLQIMHRLISQIGGESGIIDVSINSDGSRIGTASLDNSYHLWDTLTGEAITSRISNGDGIATEFSHDDVYFAAAGSDGILYLWDAISGNLIRVIDEHSDFPVRDLEFSPDNTLLASGSADFTISLLDVDTGLSRALEGHEGGINGVAFSPDGSRLISGANDNTLRLWDVASGELLETFTDHIRPPFVVRYSPDGRYFASSSWDRFVNVYDAQTSERIANLRHGFGVNTFDFSPDSTQIASGEINGMITLWDIESGTIEQQIDQHSGDISWLDYNQTGELLVSASYDDTVRLFDTSTGEQLRSLTAHNANVLDISFSGSDNLLVSVDSTGNAYVWGIPEELTATEVTTITPSPSGEDQLSSALSRAQSGVDSNTQWQTWYPDGFVLQVDGFERVLVPAGCLPDSESDCDTIDAFWIDQTEVTNIRYGSAGVWGFPNDSRPRDSVTWRAATAFCLLNGGSLPTEAEWEYAASGPDSLKYPWGDTFDADLVIYEGNADQSRLAGSIPEGRSWVGAYDMSGNLWEWTSTRLGTVVVLRGGSWFTVASAFDLTSEANRLRIDPDNVEERLLYALGFRCIYPISESTDS